MILPAPLVKRIVVNRHIARKNKKHGTDDPAISVNTSRGVFYGHRVMINGPVLFVQDREHPLACGATVWAETRATVEVDQ